MKINPITSKCLPWVVPDEALIGYYLSNAGKMMEDKIYEMNQPVTRVYEIIKK